MRNIKRIHTIAFLSLLLLQKPLFSYQAVTIVPVADLVGSALKTNHEYSSLPICGGRPRAFSTCKRLHQLIFNEIVDVKKELHGQVEVALPHLFFVPHNDTKRKISTFWTLKKNLLPLTTDALKEVVPRPISYTHQQHPDQKSITLIMPYTPSEVATTFSAGTRFILKEEDKKNKTSIVALIHPKKHIPIEITIPSRYCLKTAQNKTQQRKNFVKLVRLWAQTKGSIPYVWGGCSSIFRTPNIQFKEIFLGESKSYYEVKNEPLSTKTGLDCAGLVIRAAQAAGLPYFFKNTTTLATYLEPLNHKEKLEDGDLLWIPGHVMVVSNREKNLLVEARDYSSGWGKIHETPLNRIFKDISTYEELEKYYQKHKPLQRVDRNGYVANTYPTFKLLSLNSIWT